MEPHHPTRMSHYPDIIQREPPAALSEAGLGEAWVAEEAVVCALYCVERGATFEEVVVLGANTDGDSDSIAAIAGSIAGARGLSTIPQTWVRRIEDSVKLLELADDLFSAYQRD